MSNKEQNGNFAKPMLVDVTFPKRNTRFKLEDFFQLEVDDFHLTFTAVAKFNSL